MQWMAPSPPRSVSSCEMLTMLLMLRPSRSVARQSACRPPAGTACTHGRQAGAAASRTLGRDLVGQVPIQSGSTDASESPTLRGRQNLVPLARDVARLRPPKLTQAHPEAAVLPRLPHQAISGRLYLGRRCDPLHARCSSVPSGHVEPDEARRARHAEEVPLGFPHCTSVFVRCVPHPRLGHGNCSWPGRRLRCSAAEWFDAGRRPSPGTSNTSTASQMPTAPGPHAPRGHTGRSELEALRRPPGSPRWWHAVGGGR